MEFTKQFKNPPIEYWPEVRWWLAEGFHTDETLLKDIEMLHSAGFGAVEFLAMDEPGADSRLYGWGSEEWVHDTHTIVREATKRGMGVSFTSGTNWSNANLPNFVHRPDDPSAAKELNYTVEALAGRTRRHGRLRRCEIENRAVQVQQLIAVVAVAKAGEAEGKPLLIPSTAVLLTDRVQGETLDWTAPDGDWLLFAFWMHGTGQTACPSVSVSYTVNYLDPYGIEAFIDYWDRVVLTPELQAYIRKNGRVQMYMDSLELTTYGRGGQLWGYQLLEKFKAARGYDLAPYLPFVVKQRGLMGGPSTYNYHFEPASDPDFIRKLRNDLYQTMTDLYIESMLAPMQDWLHSHSMELRAEISYGLPFEISLPGKYVDGIETESLEFASQIESFRSLAGPAHLFDRIYSSETGATLLNYQMGLDFYTQIIYTQFAAGVTRTVLHGYSSIAGSEESTRWPGHEGMWPLFSERFGCRQPAWQHYRDWTAMLARYQYLLRQGKPRMDLAILRLDYNFNNLYMNDAHDRGCHEQELYERKLMRGHEGIYWQDMALQDAGYTYDYFAPQLLEDEDVVLDHGNVTLGLPGYRALLIYQEALPLSSARRILAWAQEGLPVALVDGCTEQLRPLAVARHVRAASVTPFHGESDDALREVIAQLESLPNVRRVQCQAEAKAALASLGVFPRAAFSQPNENILSCLRETDGGYLLYLYHYRYAEPDAKAATFTVHFPAVGVPYQVDCWRGDMAELGCYQAEEGRTAVTLTLMPGESAVIALDTIAEPPLHAVKSDAPVVVREGVLALRTEESRSYTTLLSDGRMIMTDAKAPVDIPLPVWRLQVEDWNEGEKKTIVEDRGLGIVTTEVYYETEKKRIEVGETPLLPWRRIPSVWPEVSGVGYYETHFTLPANWGAQHGAYLSIGSTGGNTAAVYVNGQKAPGFDFDRRKLDISTLLQPGENALRVEVSSTLNNRLLARGYYAEIREGVDARVNAFKDEDDDPIGALLAGLPMPEAQDYGMTGTVKLVTYEWVPLL